MAIDQEFKIRFELQLARFGRPGGAIRRAVTCALCYGNPTWDRIQHFIETEYVAERDRATPDFVLTS